MFVCLFLCFFIVSFCLFSDRQLRRPSSWDRNLERKTTFFSIMWHILSGPHISYRPRWNQQSRATRRNRIGDRNLSNLKSSAVGWCLCFSSGMQGFLSPGFCIINGPCSPTQHHFIYIFFINSLPKMNFRHNYINNRCLRNIEYAETRELLYSETVEEFS